MKNKNQYSGEKRGAAARRQRVKQMAGSLCFTGGYINALARVLAFRGAESSETH